MTASSPGAARDPAGHSGAAGGGACPRAAGRPRSAEADRAILDAALDELVECGWDGLTVEGVAARAGVGKTTIYRRYPSKVDLMLAAAQVLALDKEPLPDTGSLAGDVRALGRSYVTMLTRSRVGRVLPATITAMARSPEVARAHRRFVAEHRALITDLIGRAVERGELAPGADVELFVDMLFGPLFYRVFISKQPVGERVVDALVEHLTAAFGATTVAGAAGG